MFLRRITALFSREIKSNDTVRPEIHRQFCNFLRYPWVHIAHGTENQTALHAEIAASAVQATQNSLHHAGTVETTSRGTWNVRPVRLAPSCNRAVER